jgi:hypothetical protein
VTVVVAVNAVDSIVLASDSTTTQALPGLGPINTWNSANKIFNLRKTWPIGAITWGRASLDGRSIATLAKELRCRFSGDRPDHADWTLDRDKYSIADVAERVKSFFRDEHYLNEPQAAEVLGLAVAGYSSGSDQAEMFIIEMNMADCRGPEAPVPAGQPYLTWRGQPEAISRLANGFSSKLGEALVQLGVAQQDVPAYVDQIKAKTALPLVHAGMPIGEAIDLADFLVEATIKFVRFAPGHQSVGGPVEIAAMTRHEGFKWIKRKHHYPQSLNVGENWP